jgi:Na+/proline symporter
MNAKVSVMRVVVVMAAVAVTGLLAGASLDQSVKQLPARKRIGAIAYSAYAQAADLHNGIALYAVLGVGAAVLSIVAAVVVWRDGNEAVRLPAVVVGMLAVLHSAATTYAAPTMFSQRQVLGNEAALARVFDRFARWQAYRCALQLANFAALLWLCASMSAPTL